MKKQDCGRNWATDLFSIQNHEIKPFIIMR